VKFQVKRVGNVYMLRNLKVTVGGLQLSLVSKATVMEQSKTMMFSNSDVQLSPEERLGLGAQQESPYHSYLGANFHKSCVDEGNRWVIKFKLELNLFDIIKL